MASNRFLMITIVAMFLPSIAMATEYIVGDSSRWTISYDYQAWAKDKVFRVGDKLVFQYPQGVHNVFKVNGTAFNNCDIPPQDQALTSGNDTILLATPGRKWYICGVADHCSSYGQKLNITVYSYGWAPAPAPSSPWAPTPPSPSEPTTPATPTESWASPPQPWAPIPAPALAPSSPWAPTTSSPSVPTTPATPTESWPPAPSPYPWI